MIESRDAVLLKSQGYLVTSCPALDRDPLLQAFRLFLAREPGYRRGFLQKNYGYAYDGYSYLGQSDSSHQAEDDLVSTMVLSQFTPRDRFPAEFHSFLDVGWREALQTVRRIEIALLERLNLPGLLDFYHRHAGHMLSSNHYPPVRASTSPAAGHTRLSAHPDASLFTLFPFGNDAELELEVGAQEGAPAWRSVDAAGSILLYPGYLMEMWTQGEIRAKNHRVRLGSNSGTERFTFSFFSLPFPRREFVMPGRDRMSSEAYFQAYDDLF